MVFVSWWDGIVATESGWLVVDVVTGSSWVFCCCFSGELEYLNSGSDENICFSWAGVDRELRHLSVEDREGPPVSDDNILGHHGLSWGDSDSAMPQRAQRWQHWVTEKDLAACTPVARWLVLPHVMICLHSSQTLVWLCPKLLTHSHFESFFTSFTVVC